MAREARELWLNVSALSEAALREARAKAWAEENAGALAEREAWLREHGPLGADCLPEGARLAWDEWRRER